MKEVGFANHDGEEHRFLDQFKVGLQWNMNNLVRWQERPILARA